ncbi:hypothetical protein Z517_09331 [Fonsecaea pedrosoi CBS 271.37]|uniref:Uncharacterized protein n=1 Tax=Fonsecaea pedrosoi CBS 271.37 TaxID=1442368 RepID=A0A0D2ERK3_9EURO|nr:uncharacterized protein Z517_09331 [Fonsecaea pedrosoi CBS 271.37]KIW76887.1 hypothetical protein Z517_09331 [Fonsecaea pedrosoi CBS 271.37]
MAIVHITHGTCRSAGDIPHAAPPTTDPERVCDGSPRICAVLVAIADSRNRATSLSASEHSARRFDVSMGPIISFCRSSISWFRRRTRLYTPIAPNCVKLPKIRDQHWLDQPAMPNTKRCAASGNFMLTASCFLLVFSYPVATNLIPSFKRALDQVEIAPDAVNQAGMTGAAGDKETGLRRLHFIFVQGLCLVKWSSSQNLVHCIDATRMDNGGSLRERRRIIVHCDLLVACQRIDQTCGSYG